MYLTVRTLIKHIKDALIRNPEIGEYEIILSDEDTGLSHLRDEEILISQLQRQIMLVRGENLDDDHDLDEPDEDA